MGVDISNRVKLRNALADLSTWQTWTGLADQSARRARIVWPELELNVFPQMVISLNGSRWSELGSADSSSQMRAAGALAVKVWDAYDTDNTLQEDEDRFGGLVGDLIRDYVGRDEAFELLSQGINQPANPYTLMAQNTHHSQDVDADDVDDATQLLVWQGVFFVDWGWR